MVKTSFMISHSCFPLIYPSPIEGSVLEAQWQINTLAKQAPSLPAPLPGPWTHYTSSWMFLRGEHTRCSWLIFHCISFPVSSATKVVRFSHPRTKSSAGGMQQAVHLVRAWGAQMCFSPASSPQPCLVHSDFSAQPLLPGSFPRLDISVKGWQGFITHKPRASLSFHWECLSSIPATPEQLHSHAFPRVPSK